MKRLKLTLAGLLLAIACAALVVYAQTPITLVFSNAQQAVPTTVTQNGTPGTTSYCYWIVANYAGGNAQPAGPLCTTTANATLGTLNYDIVSFGTPTTPLATPTQYDILRTTGITPPTGACNCAVATAQAGSPVNDQSNSLNSYTVSTAPAVAVQIVGDNVTLASSTFMKHLINNVVSFAVKNVASTVDYLQVDNAAASGTVALEPVGTDASIPLNLKSKGTSGTIQFNGVQAFDNTGAANTGVAGTSPVLAAYGSITTANINTGTTIVAAVTGRTIKLLHFSMQAIGGAATTCTAIQFADTAGTPVVGVSVAIAGLTQNTVVQETAASNVTLTTFLTGLTASQGLQILKTGSACTAMTSMNYEAMYTYQ